MRPFTFAGVFDIECAGWDTFLCGQIRDRDGTRFASWDEDALARELISREGIYYAHAGGRYDCLWLLDWACRHGIAWSAKLRGAGILVAKVGNVELRDSFAIAPMSLAKLAPLGGGRKSELDLPCRCGEECGGYCSLGKRMSRAQRSRVEGYLDNDCDTLDAAIGALADRCADDEIALGLTVGGTAWRTAKEWLGLPSCQHDVPRYQAIREGYYGGRTEVFRTLARLGFRYDIHSSYPAALSRVALPIGEPSRLAGANARAALRSGKPGIYTAKLRIPESHVPPLPVRMTDRLLYPYGEVSGTWTGLELQHAVSMGAAVLDVSSAYAWDRAAPVLAPYAERVWAIRGRNDRASKVSGHKMKGCCEHRCGKCADGTYAAWIKWLANSLTGKCAQRPEHESLTFVPAPGGVDDGADVIRQNDYGAFVAEHIERVDACAHVEWAAYLTAEARCELHRQLYHATREIPGGEPLYCDTDSVYASRPLTRRLGDALGEWGYEGEAREWRALAPKVYSYCDEKGERVVKGKGFSGLDGAGFDALEVGGAWTIDRGVRGIRTSVRSKDSERIFARKSLTREMHPVDGWVGGRILLDDGSTRATTVARYLDR